MPYIKKDRRAEYEKWLQAQPGIFSPGDLNYVVTRIVHAYIDAVCPLGEFNYTGLNEAIGALECAKLELYRRTLAPYEDQKIKENGDVP